MTASVPDRLGWEEAETYPSILKLGSLRNWMLTVLKVQEVGIEGHVT